MVRTAAGRGTGEEPLTNVNLQQSLSANAKSVLDLDMIYLTLAWTKVETRRY